MSTSAQPVRANDADALVAGEYQARKASVLRAVAGKLAASGVRLPEHDLDAAYNEAWHCVYAKLTSGEWIENREALLVTIAHRRALNEHRAARAGGRADLGDLDAVGVDPDLDRRLDDRTRLRRLGEGLRDQLDRRELHAATLCYLQGYSRPEAARAIGVRPRRMEKIMDRVSRKVEEIVGELRAGSGCDRHESLIRAYAIGLLEEGGERHGLARDHLDECPSCRRRVLAMRGLASVAPPAPVLLAGIAGSGSSGGAASRSARTTGQGRKIAVGTAAAAATGIAAAAIAFSVRDGGDADPPSSAGSAAGGAGSGAGESGGAPAGGAAGDAAGAGGQARARRAPGRARESADPAPPAAAEGTASAPAPVESSPSAGTEGETDPPPSEPEPAPAPEPVSEDPPASEDQPASEEPSAEAEPPAQRPPLRDAAVEFELR